MHPSPSVAALLVCLAFFSAISTNAQTRSSDNGLVIVTPGIKDEAGDDWVGIASTISSTRERWVIQEEGISYPYGHLTHIPNHRIIRIRRNASQESIRRTVRAIANANNATVIVDMNIPLTLMNPIWRDSSQWAARVVQALAESHLDKHPNSRTMWIGHSAGTEPMAMVPAARQGTGRPLFDKIYALSPRRIDKPGYPAHTTMVLSDGDFYESPGGTIGVTALVRAYGEPDAKHFAKNGYAVLRIAEGSGAAAMARASGNVLVEFAERVRAHRLVTDVANPDRKLYYYEPVCQAPCLREAPAAEHEMPSTSIGNALRALSGTPGGPPGSVSQAISKLRAQEPTPGLGGISLNATAQVPVDPSDVDQAGYSPSEQRLYLRLRGGQTVRLPQMDPDVAKLSYEIAYLGGRKAELSIGGARMRSPEGKDIVNPAPPGHYSVYYFGGTQNTMLGLIMYQADAILWRLTFGSTDSVREVAEKVPGFRSMPELFPAKYTEGPDAARHSGADLRIFINPSRVELVLVRERSELVFGQTEFAVRLGSAGPAETFYAAFFQSHFEKIAGTETGAPLAHLIPYAQSMAVFRWLRENRVRFDASGLTKVVATSVFTPSFMPVPKPVRLEDINPLRPTVFFESNGPSQVVHADGRESRFEYDKARVVKVTRSDGALLTVQRDALGLPTSVRWGSNHFVAFVRDDKLGLVLARNARENRDGRGVEFHNDTQLFRISNPENIIAALTIRFAKGEERP